MNIGFILQVVGLTIDFFSALVLTVSEIRTKREIEHESGTYIGENPFLKENMKRRNLFAMGASITLVLGFLLQIIGLGYSNI